MSIRAPERCHYGAASGVLRWGMAGLVRGRNSEFGCGDTCPIFPGRRYEDWELTDPAGQAIELVRAVRDDIEQRAR